MRAFATPSYGPPEVLRAVERPVPVPGPSEVRIAVEAVAVTRGDDRVRGGEFPGATAIIGRAVFGVTRPRAEVQGAMFAGRVADAVAALADTVSGLSTAVADLTASLDSLSASVDALNTAAGETETRFEQHRCLLNYLRDADQDGEESEDNSDIDEYEIVTAMTLCGFE